jgi:hypothetical protein
VNRTVRITTLVGLAAGVVLGVLIPSVLAGGFSVNTTAVAVVVVVTLLAGGLFGNSGSKG